MSDLYFSCPYLNDLLTCNIIHTAESQTCNLRDLPLNLKVFEKKSTPIDG